MISDALLRLGAVSQDKAEFEALFLSHYEGVYRLLFRIVGSRQGAEDLAQETFLRLYRQRFAEGRQHNVRAWLYRVATHLAYNALRDERRREERQEKAAHHDMIKGSQAMDPAEIAAQQSEREMVRRVLADLPTHQARLLLLRYAGLSYQELAEIRGVAPGSVGTLLARAHAAFAAAYRASGLCAEKGEEHEV